MACRMGDRKAALFSLVLVSSSSREAHTYWSWVSRRKIKREREVKDIQNNEFYSVAKGDVEQGANGVAHVMGDGLGGKAQETSQRDDRDGVDRKDDGGGQAMDGADDDAGRDKDQKDVEPAVEQNHLGGGKE